LDVYAGTIAIAVAEPNGEVRSLGIIANRLESIRKAVAKLGPVKQLKACYEAGPTSYVLYWQLTQLGVSCEDQHRARQRLGKFLLRRGAQPPAGIKKKWTAKYMTWLHEHVHFEQPALHATLTDYVHEVHHAGERIVRLEKAMDEAIASAPEQIRSVIAALQALRGVAQMTAVMIVAETGSLSRFQNPRQLMSYSGLISSEYSGGNPIQRGGITKTGNAHLRRVMVEAAATRFCARTRALSPRQLPTDHDGTVPTRGYQSDQPSHSLLPATPAAAYSYAPRNPLTRISASRLLWVYVTLDKIAPYQK
jgi:hypothetical protein